MHTYKQITDLGTEPMHKSHFLLNLSILLVLLYIVVTICLLID